MEFIILFITILFVSILQITIPFLVKRNVVFGVTIPYEHAQDPKIMQYKKRYALITAIISVIVLIGFLIWSQVNTLQQPKLVLTGSILPFVILFTSMILYFFFHYKLSKLKREEDWYSNIRQVHVTDLRARAKDEMLSSFVHLIPMVITATLILLSANLFEQLPNQIPIHWGADGQPDAFTDKSWISVLNLPFILLIMQAMFLAINIFTKRSGIKIQAGNVTSSTLRQLRLRKYSSWFLFLTNILITILFSFLQLNLLYDQLFSDRWLLFFPFGFLFVMLIGALVLAVKVGSVDSDLEGKGITGQTNEQESVDEDKYWKGGIFYFNPHDPSIFVEKRFSIGWTLNFANPIGYVVVFLPVIIILILSFTL
ncbi:DUF1648 domain-containing protein [Aquibacillus sediminis]|uniref:DUF1648 domain-containing protein n=1 Tax=Aquibacillus sediminis TaxID=2574734 RepID=UPI001FE6FB4F|nr:DUF5808 domain-containing protein [Aquibacillus sediminis]